MPVTFAVANERLPELLKSATKSLGEVRDLESARKVVPMLNKATDSIDDFGKHAADWTADARKSLGEHVSNATPDLQAAVAKILANKEVRKEVESPVSKLLSAVTKLLPTEAAAK